MLFFWFYSYSFAINIVSFPTEVMTDHLVRSLYFDINELHCFECYTLSWQHGDSNGYCAERSETIILFSVRFMRLWYLLSKFVRYHTVAKLSSRREGMSGHILNNAICCGRFYKYGERNDILNSSSSHILKIWFTIQSHVVKRKPILY